MDFPNTQPYAPNINSQYFNSHPTRFDCSSAQQGIYIPYGPRDPVNDFNNQMMQNNPRYGFHQQQGLNYVPNAHNHGNFSQYNSYNQTQTWPGHFDRNPPFPPTNFHGFHQNDINVPRQNGPRYCGYPRRQHDNAPKEKTGNCRCEPCERDFTSESALVAHQKMHVECEQDGCSYTASSKAVKLHYIQIHAEGKFRISLQTPEEIQKWREERKRNWPTLSNVAAKKQKWDDNKRDGILLENKEFTYRDHGDRRGRRGRNCGGIRARGRGRKEPRFDKNYNKKEYINNNNKNKIDSDNSSVTVIPTDTNNADSSEFSKLNESIANEDTSNSSNTLLINDDLSSTVSKNGKTVEHESDSGVANHLNRNITGLSLLQSYSFGENSDDEDASNNISTGKPEEKEDGELESDNDETQNKLSEGECDNEEPSRNEVTTLPVPTETRNKVETITEIENSEEHIDRKFISNKITHNQQNTKKRNPRSKHNYYQNKEQGKYIANQRGHNSRKLSLLEMLLAKEIRHERNVILQCIRHIINENFLQR